MRWRPSTTAGWRVESALAIGTVAVVAASLIATAVNQLTPIESWRQFFDVRAESNLPTWWNASLLVAIAIGAVIAAATSPARPVQHAWHVIAAAAAYLSIDETAGLHERLGNLVDDTPHDLPTYAWLLPGAVLATGGVAVLVVAGRRLPRPTAWRLAAALACYGAGAVVLEGVNGWLDAQGWRAALAAGSTVEESVEIGACVLAVTAIVDHVAGGLAPDRRLVRAHHAAGPNDGEPARSSVSDR